MSISTKSVHSQTSATGPTVVMGQKRKQCPQCGARVKPDRGLTQHNQAKHPAPEPGPQAPLFYFPTPNLRTPSPPLVAQSPPSPVFSSRRSPRRRQNGSPIRLPWSAAPLDLQKYGTRVETHPILDGTPCDPDGYDLPSDTVPAPSPPDEQENDYSPFQNATEFKLAEFLYNKVQMSAGDIDTLATLISELVGPDNSESVPFNNHKELYGLIDAIRQGDIAWESFTVKFNGDLPDDMGSVPAWKQQEFQVWFRDPLAIMEQMLANPTFANQFDSSPKRLFKNGKRLYHDLMTGNWAWFQCDKIAEDENTHGAMFCPVVLGSDKTTVSVATGQNDYYPLYISLGNVHSSVRRAHRNAVALLGFLAVPKTSQDHASSAEFRKFRRQLFHTSLEHVLSHLRPYMTSPRITKCPDGYYRRVIYGLGPYIADYPEQALLACIVQNWCPRCTSPPDNLDSDEGRRSHEHTASLLEGDGCTLKELWDDYGIVGDLRPFTASFPRADIHELLAPDLLHQIIKGTFKDHLVDWVFEYIDMTYSKQEANKRKADIDRCISITTPYAGLRQFHEGRGFKQWTGDDSKGLMKIFLPAIVGHVPHQMVRAIADFMEFCYLVRRSVIDENALDVLDETVARFHRNREVFRSSGVRPEGFSLPRQHSMVHYRHLIQQFGAPNGLCSSITESKHIKAVKRPWRRSSRNQPLGQMLLTNQRLDKLAAYRVDNESQGKLQPLKGYLKTLQDSLPPPPQPAPDDDEDEGAVDEPFSQGDVKLSKRGECLARGVPRELRALAVYVGQSSLPTLIRHFLYNQSHRDAPGGQRGCDVPLDRCPEIADDHPVYLHNSARATFFAPSDMSGLGGMRHERIRTVQSWFGGAARYDCVFMEGDTEEDGFSGLLPDYGRDGSPNLEVVHLDCLYRGAHLIGISGDTRLPATGLAASDSLDAFEAFYLTMTLGKRANESEPPRTPKRQATVVIASSQSPEILVARTPCKSEPHDPNLMLFSVKQEEIEESENNGRTQQRNLEESETEDETQDTDKTEDAVKASKIKKFREEYSKGVGKNCWGSPYLINSGVSKPALLLLLFLRFHNVKTGSLSYQTTYTTPKLRCQALELNLEAASYAVQLAGRDRDRAVERSNELTKEVVALRRELRRLQDGVKSTGWDLLRLADRVDM
ncbi:hypothetical protein D9758_018852 [Tetrapyrgos nigripes]|uniref:C2H2-type domain-containing protein n=1 Tax=Tetrapyrgos nigripes TaxID=182062 RepID=A0A8H5B1B4_9AGAR|nr:hypothetical protein D9758_018852 [Tetrapyrgos nigripes]